MKRSFLILTLGICLSLKAQESCNCWTKAFSEKGLHYKEEFQKIEAQLLKRGYLKEISPKGYWVLLSQIIEANDYFMYDIYWNPIFKSEFDSCFLSNKCRLEDYSKFQKMFDLMTSYRDLSPEKTFKDFKKTFDKKDFESTLVRHYFLAFYVASMNRNYGITQMLPPFITNEEASSKKFAQRNIMRIFLGAGDSIQINDSIVRIEEVRLLVLKHILDTSNSQTSPEMVLTKIEGQKDRLVSMQMISLQNRRSTFYKNYGAVQNEIIAAYQEGRDRLAVKEFGISYSEMKTKTEYQKQLEIIETLLPQRISE